MEFKPATLEECTQDFIINVWPSLFPKNRGAKNKEWARIWMFIRDFRAGKATEGRTLEILRTYGGERYEIGVTCGIKTETEK